MILFIAPNPHKVDKKEGFLQRVAVIDSLFLDEEKIYFDDINDVMERARLIRESDVIYVHSMYNANKILPCYEYFADKIITDLHGVVPEEEQYIDNNEMASVMGNTEEFVFKYGAMFVSVSNAMKEHFQSKYPYRRGRKWITLPIHSETIVDKSDTAKIDKSSKNKDTVIYAGGGQRWQNVDAMIEIANKTSKYEFIFLSHDKKAFLDLKNNDSTLLKSVSSQEVAKYYKKASMGFILRDDTIVNRVACPTKLIEYLENGVVPIVLSENIGDFNTLGYKYFKPEQLIEGTISAEDIKCNIENNYRVYNKFMKLADKGKSQLIKYRHFLASVDSGKRSSISVDAIYAYLKGVEDSNLLLRRNYQVEAQKIKIGEYAKMAEYYKAEYDNLAKRIDKIVILRKLIKKSNS
ncbi:MAG: hypothetical protein EOO17_00355 [Chloroflexi bacterium]|nr:MAG: hypothetical protein EOO17_00355 [Chloroflexota bacterium]